MCIRDRHGTQRRLLLPHPRVEHRGCLLHLVVCGGVFILVDRALAQTAQGLRRVRILLRALAEVELLEVRLQTIRLGHRLRVGLRLEQALQLRVIAETVDGMHKHSRLA
eukprot:7494228-Heterocapsa_arctica.AAC.2